MSSNSKIEWTDHTFNPWEGCQKVGPGCDHCYAEARNARFGGGMAVNWGPSAPRRRTSASNWRKPIVWNKAHAEFFAAHGRRQHVFCASMADVFDNAVDPTWRADLFDLILATPNLDWLLLTKRIGNVRSMVPAQWQESSWPENVRIGATITGPDEAARDVSRLLALDCPNFISIEPLLEVMDISRWLDPTGIHCLDVCADTTYVLQGEVETTENGLGEVEPLCPRCGEHAGWTGYDRGIEWVIVGGESGPGARPIHPDWVRDIRDQCQAAGVPFLFKQWGEWAPDRAKYIEPLTPHPAMHCWGGHGVESYSHKIGKKAAGRILDGRTWDEVPS